MYKIDEENKMNSDFLYEINFGRIKKFIIIIVYYNMHNKINLTIILALSLKIDNFPQIIKLRKNEKFHYFCGKS